MATIERIIHELDNLFVFFNWQFFTGELVKPVITVQASPHRQGSVMGWCTARKMWTQTDTKEEYYEITVCPEFFDLGLVELCDTLLHEFVHLYNLQNGIMDVSRGGYYHNEKFKEQAEKHGLLVVKEPKHGWARTRLAPETIEFVESLQIDREVFNLMRKQTHTIGGLIGGQQGQSGSGGNTQTPRQSYRKYVCPGCGMAVRATKEVRVKCADCELLMKKEEKKRS